MESEVSGVDASAVVIAHELKAPLSLVRQLALVLEMKDSPTPEEVHRTSGQIVATSERALRQVYDLLKLARLEDGLFEMEPVNPRSVCDAVARELWNLFRFNRRELEIDYRNKHRLAVAHPQMLHSVVYNFCLNAMHYGGEDLPAKMIVRDKGDCIRIEVRDYGPTIPTKIWREIKDGFVRRPLEIAMRPGSSGMGLYIAGKFANHMHSNFGLVRHRDGTSFYIDLAVSRQLSMV